MMNEPLRDEVESSWTALAIALAGPAINLPPRDAESHSRRLVQLALFIGLCRSRHGCRRYRRPARRGPASRVAAVGTAADPGRTLVGPQPGRPRAIALRPGSPWRIEPGLRDPMLARLAALVLRTFRRRPSESSARSTNGCPAASRSGPRGPV